MADNVIRQDVIQIMFDTNNKVLNDILGQLDDIKKAANGTGESDGLDKVKKQANNANDSAKKLNSTLGKVGSTLGTVAKKAAGLSFKATAAGIGACATAVGTLAAKSVSAYGEFEQLKGGVETLFGAKGAKSVEEYAKYVGKSASEVKDDYKKLKDIEAEVLKNANNGYKTAGLDANAYMTTVTSFSASLIQSLNGDTKKAAALSDKAITDMSDNANKMGTDMGMIQNAYQGFAKQNYTMLDNLKLGYGGTKGEMERLLEDAGKLANTKFKITSYADVVEAIHVIQDNMGITGTTAKEAKFTIQGSLNATKAAWGNLMPALIKGGDELDQCIDNLIESVVGFENESGKLEGGLLNNLMPALEKGLGGIGTLVERIAPIIEEQLPGLIETLLPPLIRAGTSLFIGLAKSLPKIVEILIKELPVVAKLLGEGLRESFGESSFIVKIFDKIGSFFGWMKANCETVKKVAIGAGAAIGGIVVAVKGFKAFKTITSLFSSVGQGSEGVGKGEGVFSKLANVKTKTVLKGLANLAIIIGGLTLLAAALMWIAPYMAQLSDFKSILKIVAVIGILGLLGTGLAILAGKIGNINVATVAKGLANMAIVLVGFGALAAVFLWLSPYMAALGDLKSILKVAAVMGILAVLGTALSVLAGIVGLIPVSTVALGLANMAIVLVGFGALAAVFLWLSPYIAALGDLKSILKVVAVMGILGVLGTALSILAAIVGMIPIATVAMGLANMAIVLVGFGALAAVFLWLAPYISALGDMQSILKVAAIMTILGVVGTVLSVFAGIVGMIPIPIVLAGLANMALVLAGITGIIAAYGALTEIPGFVDFIASGGEILVKICDILGQMVGSLMGGAIEGLSKSLPALGKNLGDFGKNIKPLFSAMQGVDMSGVGVFFASLVGLLGIATGNEIVEGIKSFFGGDEESALSKLGTQLSDFATNSKSFFTTVAALPDEGFTKATKMFECLAGLKSLPKEGGVVGWFMGEIDYTKLSSGLASLSNEKVSKFFAFAAGLNQDGFDKATELFDCLAGLKSLPNEGGVVGWFCGEVDYSKMVEGLGQLSSDNVKKFFTMVSGLKAEAFDNAIRFFDCLASIKDLPKEGGWWDKVTGSETTTIANIAEQLGSFGDKTAAFFEQVNNLDVSNLNALWDSLKDAGKLTGLQLTTVLDSSISKLVDKVKKLPKQMADGIKSSGDSLAQAIVSIWKDAVTASIAPVNKLISGANWVMKQFGSDKTVAKWQPYARGTSGHKGGNAMVNDGRGAELVQMPNGNTFIPRGRNVLLPNAPKGMKVLDAQKTAKLFGKGAPTFRYANGTGNFDVWSYENGKSLVSAIANEFVNYDGMSGYVLNVGKAMVSTVKGEMSAWGDKLIDEFGAKGLGDYVASAGVEQWRSTVIKALKMEGQYTAANVKRTLFQMQTESGGNPRAINLWDSNAKNGIPSKGLMQVIDPTFRAYARSGYRSNIYDPLSNILASVRYATSRYGTLAKAYQGHGYSSGVGESSISLPHYTPAGSVTNTNRTEAEYNTYSPVFNLTISGTNDDRAIASKVKNWVFEAMEECFETMARNNS